MTAAVELVLKDAARLGISLRINRGRIVARPKEAVTAVLAQSIRRIRAELLAALTPVNPPRTPCWNCHGTKFFARPERYVWICERCHPPIDASVMVWHDVVAEARDG